MSHFPIQLVRTAMATDLSVNLSSLLITQAHLATLQLVKFRSVSICVCVNISCCCCCFTCFPYSRCHSATQSLSSSTTASICRSSSTHVLSYARHSSIISIHESESSKRIIRLRFVSLYVSLFPSYIALPLTHSCTVSYLLHSL